jgi:uncharacterized protein (TIGR00369 family)
LSEWIVSDGPEDRCFGCGQQNERGLKLRFRRASDGWLEAEYTAPEYYSGPPGVVHGGIQAVLLDEVLGMSIHANADGEDFNIVTADFRLRYRRPVPAETPLMIRGHIARVEEPSYFLEGEIVDPDGAVLTQAEARFRRVD